ncbi:hypothetical protein [Streptomyces iconiensis]|uniref:Integral membrane protein n=1 Tax=Streptomyces iconiensis TaxID=1384038 RepID=A0ABT6ZQ86_9ACTN|nr:hypothetical protein [Streptomyces iconiensis]MDJ1131215.1 hypothetical protein [Streptomyces iconiensis]
MTEHLARWAQQHPWPAALAAVAVLGLLALAAWCTWRAVRSAARPSSSVVIAAVGAAACTAYGADTSWRFAAKYLGMHEQERVIMFAAGEIALLACGLLGRANKTATATADRAGSAGVPGALVWVITSVQIIPAYALSGIAGGTVRAVIGPVMAGLLWHLAMGLEIRLVRPGALSHGLPAVIGRDLRERFLASLGLAQRDRSAAQIARDRATVRVVRLASRRHLGPWGRHRLADAVTRTHAAVDGERRHQLMRELAARRSAAELRTVPVAIPWAPEPVPAPYPRTPLGVTGDVLRRLDPIAAIHQVQAAHPASTPAELASLCTEYGVPVTETRVRIALHAGNAAPVPAVPEAPARPVLAAVPDPVPEDVPQPVPAPRPADGLVLDLAPMPEVHADVAAPLPVLAAAQPRTRVDVRLPRPGPVYSVDLTKRRTRPGAVPEPEPVPAPEGEPVPEPESKPSTDPLLDRARVLDAEHHRTHGRPAPIRALKTGLAVGQTTATRLRRQLDAS